MPSVDNRDVNLRFDGDDFEKGVGSSLNTLDKLKKALDFKGVDKGFNEIESASSKVNFSSLSGAINAVTQHFSAFGLIGDQVLRRIGDSIYDLEMRAINLVKSLTLDQVKEGWTKYEQKTGSVQTILNATGMSIDEVNERLERLMWYSDETSFGFTDMTTALQSMTAVGGDLDTLIPMLMGVGNATAYAGKGAAEFSRVMQYSIAQAYQTGYMNRMDWKTIVGSGVVSQALQEEFIKAAEDLGKIDPGEYDISSFNEALTNKVFDREVMEKAFGTFAEKTLLAEQLIDEGQFETATEAYAYLAETYDDLSMRAAKAAQEAKTFKEAIEATQDAVSTKWSQTFELLFGNYVEAKQLWSWLAEEMWEVFASGGDYRNDILKVWHDGIDGVSGYAMAIESLKNIFYTFKDILYSIQDAIEYIFPPKSFGYLLTITEKFRDLTRVIRNLFAYDPENMEETSDVIIALQGIIKGVAGAISIVGQVLSAVWSTIVKPILKKVLELLFPVFQLLGKIGDKIGDFAKTLKKNRTIMNFFEGFTNAIKNLKGKFDEFIERAKELPSVIQFLDRFERFKEWINGIKESIINRIIEFFNSSSKFKLPNFMPTMDNLLDALDWVMTKVNNILDFLENGSPKVQEFFKSLDFSSVGNFFSTTGQSVGEFITNVFSKIDLNAIRQKAGEIFSTVWNAIVEFVRGIDYGELWNAFLEGLDVAKDIGIITLIIGLIKDIFGVGDLIASGKGVLDAFAGVLSGFGGALKGFQNAMNATAILEIAGALWILSQAMIVLSDIPADKFYDISSGLTFIAMGVGVLLIGLGKLKAVSSKINVSTATNVSTIFQNLVNMNFTLIPKAAATIIALAGAVLMLIHAFKQIQQIFNESTAEQIRRSAITLGIVVVSITGLVSVLGKTAGNLNIGSALSIIAFAGAVSIIADTITKFRKGFDTGKTAAIALCITLLMAAFVAMEDAAPNASKMLALSAAFAVVGVSIRAFLVPAIKALSELGIGALGPTLAIVAVMAMFTGAATYLSGLENAKKAVESLLAISLTIAVIGATLYALKGLEWKDVGEILVAILGVLLLITGAALAFGSFSVIGVGIELLAVALLALGGAILAAGVGALTFATALKMVSDASVDCAFAGRNLAEGIVNFIKVLMENAPLIIGFVALVVGGILLAIEAHKIKLATTIVKTIASVIEFLAKWLQGAGGVQILFVLASVLGIILTFLSESVGPVVSVLLAIILKLINALSYAITDNAEQIWAVLENLFKSIGVLLLRGLDMIIGWIAAGLKAIPLFSGLGEELEKELRIFDRKLDGFTETIKQDLLESDAELSKTTKENTDHLVGYFKGMFGAAGNAVDEGSDELTSKYGKARSKLEEEGNKPYKIKPKVDVEPELNIDTAGAETYSYDYSSMFGGMLSTDMANADLGGIANNAFASSLLSSMGIPVDASSNVAGNVVDAFRDSAGTDDKTKPKGVFKAATDTVDTYADGLEDRKERAKTAASNVVDETLETIESYSGRAFDDGFDHIEQFASGLSFGETDVNDAVESISKTAYNGINNIDGEPLKQKFYDSALNAVKGFINGLSESKWIKNVDSAAANLGKTAWTSTAKELGEASPSKVYKKEGMYAAVGLAEGIDEYSYVVDDAASSLAVGAKKELAIGLSNINDIIDEDPNLEVEMNIIPVVDWNDVDSGLAYLANQKYVRDINGEDVFNKAYYDAHDYEKHSKYLDPKDDPKIKFGAVSPTHDILLRNINLTGKALDEFTNKITKNDTVTGAARDMSSSGVSGTSTSGSGGYDDTKLLAKIDKLDEKVYNLGFAVSRLQVVMDTGELVGAITPAVDEALGSRVAMIERGA